MTSTNWASGSCTQADSSSAPTPWWRVDFGKTAVVYSVKVTNRYDCCWSRLSDFNIKVSENKAGPIDGSVACKSNALVGRGKTGYFVCDPKLYGRYLYIQTNLPDVLTICEAQVFGEIP